MNRTLTLTLVAIALAAGVSAGYFWGRQSQTAAPQPQTPGERRILYWYDPMVPDKRFDQPGKSPFMDMDLLPRYADESVEDDGVAVSARQQQNLGVQTARAEVKTRQTQVSGYGTVTLNERSLHTLVAPAGGMVEKLYVAAAQQQVRQGETLAVIWNPAWAAAQREYLAVRQLGDRELTLAARSRLALLFMPESVIRQVETSAKAQPRMVVTSPFTGYVNKLEVRVGAQLAPAQPLLELASLDPAWIEVDYPESQAAVLTPGSAVTASGGAWPGETFHGRISEILPLLDSATRTLRARVAVDNPQLRLKPGMYLNLQLTSPPSRQQLVIPQQALLISGNRNRVLLSDGDGRFTPREVSAGASQDGWVAILDGLQPGDRVVTSGQFLIDSEASLRSSLDQFAEPDRPAPPPAPDYGAAGVIKALSDDAVTIEHGAVPELNWAPMTMDFVLPADGLPPGISPGSRVAFRFLLDDGGARLVSIAPLTDDAHSAHGGH
ncbi:efflux RND transporter periplasmic adaptor subunit [Affinibrenneria salicis]|uniref:Efflux RND transporter periplasmic adaptor subunit n=1 Tax=Affinibrenneria salicis TaxID=2590031 RepID=A0A5J5G0P2_9GAMM|nr:efflux RND transporter periplasmic adaptor subunit [Affinibrenneria salicis]KAA8999884.1 efflux RND transporter periplasmic adaptor subunit [Affinibrenneria salicis]